MLLSAVLDRLQSQVPALQTVGTLSEVDPDTLPAQYPAAFVLSIRDSAAPNRIAAGSHRQELTEVFGVLMVVSQPTPADQAVLELEGLKDEVRQALIGWLPADGWTACNYASGALVDARPGGIIWWLQQFSTSRQIIKR